jgi:hypothetical protein
LGEARAVLKSIAPDDRIYELIIGWLSSYVMQPHAELGRPGPVCPFVAKAMRTDSVSVMARTFDREPDLHDISVAIDEAMNRLPALARGTTDPELACLIVVFPELTCTQWHLIDDVHRERKTAAVRRGLMLGQFHPNCDAPAAHNPRFPVNRAPVPLIVIRQMAEHDILFLQDDPVWLDQYRAMLARRKIAVEELAYRDHYERAVGRTMT